MWRFISTVVQVCQAGMVPTGVGTCIDLFPYPNYEGMPPMLGLSAVPTDYLDLLGETWDAETLCASRGKRLCSWDEWRSACRGSVQPALVAYLAPDWSKVDKRDGLELWRLNQYPSALEHPETTGWSGARMMTAVQEWIRYPGGVGGYAFSRGFWSREGGCDSITVGHDPRFFDYATTGRCCK